MCVRHKFSKVLSTAASHRKHTRALTYENFCQHPIKTTMYFLSDALKKLRKVCAKTNPSV
jgi:hypothetical protein